MRNNERYTLGYGAASIAMMASRTAENHAEFFLTHLIPGMNVLDVGCGPGTITLGFAEKIYPGTVTGIELDLVQTKSVSANASEELNLHFATGDIYQLDFDDSIFDAIFASALIGNLKFPLKGIEELKRVLKPGGILGIKEFDHSANIAYPVPDFQEEIENLYNRLRISNGHDPDSGRKVKSYLHEAGFENINCTAVFHNVTIPEGKGSSLMEALVRDEWGPAFIRKGWVTSEQVEKWIKASEIYERTGSSFIANAWIEALCRKAD
ncbi:MAG: methyltransferase domain-containing protein [Gammaproteobacteria bacterium]|nr:methyltransferase domain-containing protein [Gammaproteobacteria bacterium]